MLKWILSFLLACCCIFWLASPLGLWHWLLLAVSILLLLTLSPIMKIWGSFLQNPGWFKSILVSISGFCFGLAWISIHAQQRLNDQITLPQPRLAIIEAKLVSIPEIYHDSIHFDVMDQQGKKLRLSWYQYEKDKEATTFLSETLPKLGEKWRFRVRLKPIYSALNPAGFDGERYAFTQGLTARGNIQKNQAERLEEASLFSLSYLRQWIYEELDHYENAGILQALILGEKAKISVKQQNIIRSLGISHLLAISGLHIAIIAGLSLWLTQKLVSQIGWLNKSFSPLNYALLVSIIAALFYSALAGFSVATLRALLMWLAVVYSLLNARQAGLVKNLGFALLIILLLDPLAVLSYGFWLTFAAVVMIGLILMGRPFKASRWLLAIKLQFYLSFGMSLLNIGLFQQLSLISFFANIILIPLFSLIILPFLFLSVVSKIIFNWTLPLKSFDYGLSHFFNWVEQLQLVDTGLFLDVYLPGWLLIVLALIFILMLYPLSKVKYIPMNVLLVIATLGFFNQPKQQDYKLIVFDVGHGLANLIYNQQTAILYDSGFANEHFSNANLYVLPSLRKLGIRKIDLLVTSHQDLDHSGGYQNIKSQLKVLEEIDQDNCKTDQQWIFNGMKLSVVYAQTNPDVKANNRSCVIKVETENKSVLLTGDIEKLVELALARRPELIHSDILLAPHHGSNTSSTYPFIKSVSPEIVIHSTDRFNRYGMPHPKVVARYRDFKIQQLSTGCSGAIRINLNTGELQQMRSEYRSWRNRICFL